MRRLSSPAEREKAEAARITEWRASLPWVPFAERCPEPCAACLVRFADGTVGGGHWDGKGWYHSPFERWGEPVEWALLPPCHKTP